MKAYAEMGTTLRTAREKAGRSISEVASETGLPERYVVALEKGDMADLPDLSYARLYLQSYARSLRLDPDSMLAAWPAARPVVAEKTPREEARVRTKSKWPLYAASLLLLLVIGSAVLFVRDSGAPSGGSEVSQAPTQPQARPVTAPPPVRSTPAEPAVTDPSATSAATESGTSQNPAESSPNLLAQGESQTLPEASLTSDAQAQPAFVLSGIVPVSPFKEPEPVPVILRSLDVVVASQTWLVIEADGDTVVAKVAARGEKVSAEARSDFRLTVANPRDLQVLLDGKPFELSVRSNRPLIRHQLPGKDTP